MSYFGMIVSTILIVVSCILIATNNKPLDQCYSASYVDKAYVRMNNCTGETAVLIPLHDRFEWLKVSE